MAKFILMYIISFSIYGQKQIELNDAQVKYLLETVEKLKDNEVSKFISYYKEDERFSNFLSAIPSELPLDRTKVGSNFGLRFHPIDGKNKMHNGLDLKAEIGTKVYASGNGIVEFSGYKSGNGNCVIIKHLFGFESLYCHLEEIYVSEGEIVSSSDILGTVGNTGKSTGPHLHFAIKRQNKYINPIDLLRTK